MHLSKVKTAEDILSIVVVLITRVRKVDDRLMDGIDFLMRMKWLQMELESFPHRRVSR